MSSRLLVFEGQALRSELREAEAPVVERTGNAWERRTPIRFQVVNRTPGQELTSF